MRWKQIGCAPCLFSLRLHSNAVLCWALVLKSFLPGPSSEGNVFRPNQKHWGFPLPWICTVALIEKKPLWRRELNRFLPLIERALWIDGTFIRTGVHWMHKNLTDMLHVWKRIWNWKIWLVKRDIMWDALHQHTLFLNQAAQSCQHDWCFIQGSHRGTGAEGTCQPPMRTGEEDVNTSNSFPHCSLRNPISAFSHSYSSTSSHWECSGDPHSQRCSYQKRILLSVSNVVHFI